jgi:hypothetical protein
MESAPVLLKRETQVPPLTTLKRVVIPQCGDEQQAIQEEMGEQIILKQMQTLPNTSRTAA